MTDSIAATPSSPQLPEEFRQALGLEDNATAGEALTVAEERLRDILSKQQNLPPRHPSQPRLKKDRERIEPLLVELREMVFGLKVDELCDDAEAALAQQPPKKAVARDCLKRARLEGKNLAPDSVYIRRIGKLEARLEAEPAVEQKPPPPPAPAPPVAPAPIATPPPPPANPLLRIESLVEEGMACLTQTPPELARAGKCFAAAEKESIGKNLPDALKSRIEIFRAAYDRVGREAVRKQIDAALKEVNSLLAGPVPKLAPAREKLAAAAALLKDSPDPSLQHECDSLAREIQQFEHRSELKVADDPRLKNLHVKLATQVRFRCRHLGQERIREVKATQFVIGRGSQGEDAMLDLAEDLRVSRRHARIWSEGGYFWIEDLGSKFGTRLDGMEIKGAGRRPLNANSKILLGDTTLVLLEDDTARAPFQPLIEPPAAKPPSVKIDSSLAASAPIVRSGKDETMETFLQRQSWLLELHLELAEQRNLSDLLSLILHRAVAAIPGAQRGAVILRGKDGGSLLLAAYVSDGEPPVSETLARKAMDEAAAFLWRRSSEIDPAASVRRLGIESGIYAPMIRDGRALGVICIDNPKQESSFKQDDLRLMQALAHYAAMAVSNQQMQDDLRQNAVLLERLLTNFSPKLRNRILGKAREGRLRPGGEHSEVTILFADLRGFTAATAKLDSDEVMELLNDYLPALAQAAFGFEGTIDKFTGDGLLAVFGSPEPDPEQHRHALLAAMEMQTVARRISERRAKSGLVACDLGVGVHSGDVLHGFLGSAEMLEFTVIGDAVNRASRFCSTAAGGAVLLSPEVFKHVFQFVRAEPVVIETKMEGKTNAYRVIELKQPQPA